MVVCRNISRILADSDIQVTQSKLISCVHVILFDKIEYE